MRLFKKSKRAICLLSGGLDSATTLFAARHEGYEVSALTVDYGQSHAREIRSAQDLALEAGVEHEIISVPLPWGGSALTDPAWPIPDPHHEVLDPIPATYVPARNTVFLSLALSFAEAREAEAIFIGANAVDYSGYPDCRPEFIRAFERVIQRGTKAGVEGHPPRVETPLMRLNKKSIILLGRALGVPFEKTWSCYRGGEAPCGRCDSCRLRALGFEEAGLTDPLIYDCHRAR